MEWKENISESEIERPDWVKFVSSEAPMTADEQAAVAEYQCRVPSEKRQLRAFFHEHYGQYWIYERGWPERQVGSVLGRMG